MIQIKHRFSGAVLFEADVGSMRLCVEAAVSASADLTSANLRYADLRYDDLRYADLRYADLTYADLRYANLRYANLTSAVGVRGVLSIGPIGSRADALLAVIDAAGGINLTTGCFSGSIAKFEAAVQATHGDNEHGQHYRLAIALIKAKLGGEV